MAIGRTGPGVARVIEGRKSRFLLGALVLAHLVVISRQVEGEGGVSLLQRGLWSVLIPPQRLVASAVHGVQGVWTGYVGLRGARDQNRRLQEQVHSLETQLEATRQQIEEATRLRLRGARRLAAAGRLDRAGQLLEEDRSATKAGSLQTRLLARDGRYARLYRAQGQAKAKVG